MTKTDSRGTCQLCGHQANRAAMVRHARVCAPAHDPAHGERGAMFQLSVQGRHHPRYWLALEMKARGKLRDLDNFLRNIWLECCGHLSAFEIRGIRHTVDYGTNDLWFDDRHRERSMNMPVSEVFDRVGLEIGYEYDFGSTTELRLRIAGVREGNSGRRLVSLLARNDPPVWPCTVCHQPATLVCPFCMYEGEPFYCQTHAPQHKCDDDEAWLPVVNSPRMGVCGYTGEG